MLRAYALDFGGSWHEHLPFAEFLHNNSYQRSIKMAPFKHFMEGSVYRPFVGSKTKATKSSSQII
jgi:hypothetical protein